MTDKDDKVTDREGREIPPLRKKYESRSKNERFVISFALSLAFLLFVVALSFSVFSVGALTLSGMGGFQLEVDEMTGTQVQFYPDTIETAACPANLGDNPHIVESEDEQGVVALTADVDDILIPADSELTLTKDIRLPSVSVGGVDLDGVRIKLTRLDIDEDPAYPPQAPVSDLVSVGDVPESHLDGVELNELRAFTGISDGYADLRFERTAPILEGEEYEIEVSPAGFTDYSDVDIVDYPVASAVREDRYIDGVTLQSLNNENTGPEDGYADYTELNNTGMEPDDGTPLLERGGTEMMSVEAFGSDPVFGPADDVRLSTGLEIPDPPIGEDSDEAFIDSATFEEISDENTGDDGGYREAFDEIATVEKGEDGLQIQVDGSKKTGNFGESIGIGDPGRDSEIGGIDCGTFCTTERPFYVSWGGWRDHATTDDSTTYWHNSGDNGGYGDYTNYNDFGDLTGPGLVQPGEDIELGMCMVTRADNHEDRAAVGIGRAFIDWNDDGSFDDDYFVGVIVDGRVEDNDEPIQECFDRSITVPEDAEPGGGTVRYMMNGDLVGEGDDAPDTDFSGHSGGTGEAVDYTIHVQPESQVSAFFDWSQNGEFDDEVEVGQSLDRTGDFDYSTTVDVPDDAVSGSTIMRLVHRNEIDEPVPTEAEAIGGLVGETHDYTVEVDEERTDSAAYAYFDWNQDGTFDDEQYIDHTDNNDGFFTLEGAVTPPDEAQAGSTVMRVVHQQDGWDVGEPEFSTPDFPVEDPDDFVGPGPDATDVNGEYHDYTVNVEPDGSYVRAWVDWDQDGNFEEEADFGTVGDGFGEGNFDNEGSFTLNDTIENPGGLTEPVHLMRVTHKQAIPQDGPPGPGEGEGGWTGETLDFTLVTDESLDPDTGNLTLGQGSFTVTDLEAETLDISGDVLIDDRYRDDTPENPRYGPDGEFVLGGEQASLTEVSGVAHFVGFSFFDFPGLVLELEYIDDADENPDEYRFAGDGDVCEAYPPDYE